MKSPPCPNTATVRRNPHRKARATPVTNAPTAPISSSTRSLSAFTSFPMEDILSIELPQNSKPDLPAPPTVATGSENLKVFLRIRPLAPLKGSSKTNMDAQARSSRTKNGWPQNRALKNAVKEKRKQKKADICIVVNDHHSVTLTPPPTLQDLKRAKSEVFEGFSHVFPADSTQDEVYETMVNPLVEDFLRGRSGMLAAMGPSGSGKTHTVFGSHREPGMVPLVLRRIFKQTQGDDSKLSRLFCISMFEIYSERGKGERMLDLSPSGDGLCMQQSSIKGLQEVIVSDVAQAESLIARGMLKRATAMTNSNSQSSRSQCIINICSTCDSIDGKDVQRNSAVLTIVDLAGAEREKRTGNQGTRLLESNFINNTSMVFGLCLRSLLDHQKNPKKSLQKHFQNSLLTRYLRDYLEGKKRMALILTVKSGVEDYLDSSFLLRQASPYMKIKFNQVEEPSNLIRNKRHVSIPTSEHAKRMKFCLVEASVVSCTQVKVTCCSLLVSLCWYGLWLPQIRTSRWLNSFLVEGKCVGDEDQSCEEGVSPELLNETGFSDVLVQSPKIIKLEANEGESLVKGCINWEERERKSQIMQNFAKALWNVLKQYKKKVEAVENEVCCLKESIRNEKTRNFELEKELKDLKSNCLCHVNFSANASLVKLDSYSESRYTGLPEPKGHISSNVQEAALADVSVVQFGITTKCGVNESSELKRLLCTNVHEMNSGGFLNPKGSRCDDNEQKSDATCIDLEHDCFPAISNDVEDSNLLRMDDTSTPDVAGTGPWSSKPMISSSQPLLEVVSDTCLSVETNRSHDEDKVNSEGSLSAEESNCDDNEQKYGSCNPECDSSPGNRNNADELNLLKLEEALNADVAGTSPWPLKPVASSSPPLIEVMGDTCLEKANQLHAEEDEGMLHQSLSVKEHKKDVSGIQECNGINAQEIESKINSCNKPLDLGKPKRKLLPASSILVRDISGLGIDDEKQKGSRGEKKMAADERKRTQGSISLLRLLRSNHH